ncbi:hypothetical protein HQN60_01295 [Deefgea piscis]|uniref:Uncharacterized protein n=1 Tax=Deefgea piscis TaxID=2739061 RepID=A0A6M8SRJ2_9NEIS|nr:hypothetical protein [Deefgea piscis]QKJ65479.1 hypothetical protein HQN60_01295 [Deefgea piscis]
MAMDHIEEFDIPFGSPPMDALDVPPFRDGRPMKKVVLVCPECGEKGIWIEPPDTTLKFGDAASECDECGYGLDYL